MRRIITIKKANYIGDFVLGLTFSDGIYREVNFKEFLFNSKNPMTNKFQDEHLFKSFCIEHGELNWNEYELCFPMSDLYQGRI